MRLGSLGCMIPNLQLSDWLLHRLGSRLVVLLELDGYF
jgi:hypothetical protein